MKFFHAFERLISSFSFRFSAHRSFICDFNLQLEQSVHRFGNFYSSQHSGRKLNWLYNMSKGELHTNCFKNRYTLQASTFQMAVLLIYNTALSWTIQQLQFATQIKMDFLQQVMRRTQCTTVASQTK